MNRIANTAAIAAMSAMTLASCQQGAQKTSEGETAVQAAKVLVAVDVQRDFFDPTGSLYVSGSEVLPARIAQIADSYDAVIFTLDWHPGNHCSFAAQGGPWPAHCVAYTQGAGLADEFAGILASGKASLFFKGSEQDREQYGAFEGLTEGPIYEILAAADSVDVCGIAGDYCVKESTANILKIVPAAKVTMINDCIRSIDDGSALAAFVSGNGLNCR